MCVFGYVGSCAELKFCCMSQFDRICGMRGEKETLSDIGGWEARFPLSRIFHSDSE